MATGGKTRRTKEEVTKLVQEVDALRAGGTSLEDACKQKNLARSVYDRAKKKGRGGAFKQKPKGATRGRIDVRHLPPRPKKKKRGGPWKVDRTSVSSVALRITALDKRLEKVANLRAERMELARVLQKLLQRHP